MGKQWILGILTAASLFGIRCGSTELVQVEANPPMPEVQIMNNFDEYFKQINGSPAEQDRLRQQIQRKQLAAVALGEKLFKDPRLGQATLGRSCATCHPGGGSTGGFAMVPRAHGKGPFNVQVPPLKRAAATFPKYKPASNQVITLSTQINNCLSIYVGGKRLPLNGPELYALAAYVASLGQGETFIPGEGAMP